MRGFATSLRLEGIAGTTREECAADLVRVATLLGVMTELKFNGVQMLAAPGRTVEQVLELHYRIRDSGEKS